MTESAPTLYEAMVDFFTTDQWPYLTVDDQPALTMNFEGQNARWPCYAQVQPEQQQFIFYSLCPINVPEDKRADVAEFLTRTNYGLIIGNFELDLDEGTVRYKTSFDSEGVLLTPALFRNTVYPNIAMMDQYLPDLFALIYSEEASDEQIAQAAS